MKNLTLQITKKCFYDILNGKQKVEHRFVYKSNAKRLVKENELPNGDIEVLPVDYDALYLINGRRKNAPRLTVEVTKAEFVVFTDEEGNDRTYIEDDGEEYYVCQVWYHLGKVIDYENIDESLVSVQ